MASYKTETIHKITVITLSFMFPGINGQSGLPHDMNPLQFAHFQAKMQQQMLENKSNGEEMSDDDDPNQDDDIHSEDGEENRETDIKDETEEIAQEISDDEEVTECQVDPKSVLEEPETSLRRRGRSAKASLTTSTGTPIST